MADLGAIGVETLNHRARVDGTVVTGVVTKRDGTPSVNTPVHFLRRDYYTNDVTVAPSWEVTATRAGGVYSIPVADANIPTTYRKIAVVVFDAASDRNALVYDKLVAT